MDHLPAAADGLAASTNNIYSWDLVSTHQPPEACDLGVAASASADASGSGTILKLLRVDCSLVSVKAGDDVTVVDRNYLLPSDTVASATSDQIGVVTGAISLIDLVRLDDASDQYVPTAPVIRGVPASTPGLRRVRRLNLGDFVVSGSGPWLGRVLQLCVDVDVLLTDGTVRRFADAESKKQILPENRHSAKHYFTETGLYYPGQHVYSKPSAVPQFRNGVVLKVEASGVLVHWVASPHCGTDKDLVMASAPPSYQCPRDLTYFCSSKRTQHPWTVADRCFLDGAAAATATGIDDDHLAPAASTNNRHRRRRRRRRRRKNNNKNKRLDQLEVPLSVCNTHTTFDVLWQDGTRQRGVPSTSLVPFEITVPNEFFPGQYVVDNAPLPTTTTTTAAPEVAGDHGNDDDGSTTRGRVGMVRSVNCKDQTVRVSWLKAPGSRPHWLKCHDTVSVYDLQKHPRSSLLPFYGDVVVRTNDGAAESTAAQGPADLSWVGRVINIPDGKVLVRWGDGRTSMVLHHEVCVVVDDHYMDLLEEYDTGEGEWVEDDDDGGGDAPPQETAGAADHRPANADVSAPVVLAGGGLSGAVRSVISLAAKVLAGASRYLATWLPSSAASSPTSESPAAMDMETVEVHAPAVPAGSDHQDEISDNGGGESRRRLDRSRDEISDAPGTEKSAADSTAFPRFDVVAHTPPDHHYLDSMDQSGNGGGKKWVKAVQKEWKILEDSLPDTIYVRAFEDRMDLLRAVMVGASGTPYHDGLFFFDMQLPATYPAAPPQVYYHSYGLHINPNLYPSGTVCLSLINTFGGEGTEVWSPAKSTLLQVLVSIQGLVLNDEPYYNEPANEALAGMPVGRRSALPYGENVYLLSLRTALHVLRRPPLGFEEFVEGHFRRRGRFMIRACEAYMQEGCAVGTLTDDEEGMSMERRQCSTGLKLALTNMLPSLVAAFAGVEGKGISDV